jgi:hypothetical protein
MYEYQCLQQNLYQLSSHLLSSWSLPMWGAGQSPDYYWPTLKEQWGEVLPVRSMGFLVLSGLVASCIPSGQSTESGRLGTLLDPCWQDGAVLLESHLAWSLHLVLWMRSGCSRLFYEALQRLFLGFEPRLFKAFFLPFSFLCVLQRTPGF